MYLDDLRGGILDKYALGVSAVIAEVEQWLEQRGFKEDDFSDPVFVDKRKLEILTQIDIQKERQEAFFEGVDHVLDQLKIVNPYGDRNGFLDD